MKKILIVIILIMVASFGFAKTTTTSLYAGGFLSSWHFSEPVTSTNFRYMHSIVGGGIRGVTCPNDTGFYYGADVFFGAPIKFTIVILKQWESLPSEYDFFMSFKLPFGYRWPAEGKSMAFYIGAGPFVNNLIDWNIDSIYSLGFFGEIGIQTNKTENVGFHLGVQAGVTPWMYASYFDGGGEWASDGIIGTEVTLQTGISWRRLRG